MLKTVLLGKLSLQNLVLKIGLLILATILVALVSTSNLSRKVIANDGTDVTTTSEPEDGLFHMQYQFLDNGDPVEGAMIVINNQSRVTDADGLVTFEHTARDDAASFQYIKDDKNFAASLAAADKGVIDIAEVNAQTPAATASSTQSSTDSFLSNPVYTWAITIGIILAIIVIGFLIYRFAKSRLSLTTLNSTSYKVSVIVLILVLIVVSGFAVYFLNRQSTFDPNTSAAVTQVTPTVLDTLPQPLNVKTYPDNQLITLTWDAPSNASTNKIIGYYVRWGQNGVLTDAKQTIHNITQIQPLVNGVNYTITVQAVQGAKQSGTSSNLMQANGNISKAVTVSSTPTSARVDAMRSRLTGFFDDFNLPAGNFDEKKWNSAYSACVQRNENGSYINSQFHAHNQIQSRTGEPYCDRGAVYNRPRAVFDTTGATEANPAILEFDFDGVAANAAVRDIWYVDFVPTDARKDGAIMDTTAHNDIFGDDNYDPGNMLRLKQADGTIAFQYYPENGASSLIKPTYLCNAAWQGDRTDLYGCNTSSKTATKYSPITEPSFSLVPVPNVRRHWVIEYSPSKIKVFIDGVRVIEANVPAAFSGKNKFHLYNTLFTYNTGKDQDFLGSSAIHMTTSVLHWDNFGFTGPAASTVTHNYVDGGKDGMTPFIGSGNVAYPGTSRIIKIPDAIGTPVKARLHYTINSVTSYATWNGGTGNFSLNGKSYPVASTSTKLKKSYSPVAGNNLGFSDSVEINAADLVQGNNTINLSGMGGEVMNLHIELDYPKNSAPTYTQPQNVFGTAKYNPAIMPTTRSNDAYLFFEQDFGLRQGTVTVPTTTPTATSTPTKTPTPTATATSVPTQTATPTPTSTPVTTLTTTPSPTATSTPSGSDRTGPVITITSPINGTNIGTGNLRMTASATDTSGIYKIQILMGDEVIRTCYGTTSCTATVPNGFVPSGNTVVTFLAIDNSTAKNQSTKTSTITN